MKKLLLIAAVLLLAPTFASGQCLLTYQTESLPTFYVGQPANFTIEAVSGTPPYRFEIIDGALPDGLHLTANGRIRGVPTTVMDTTVLILLSDAAGCTLGQAFAVRVEPAEAAP